MRIEKTMVRMGVKTKVKRGRRLDGKPEGCDGNDADGEVEMLNDSYHVILARTSGRGGMRVAVVDQAELDHEQCQELNRSQVTCQP
jgi:hypothetical protein